MLVTVHDMQEHGRRFRLTEYSGPQYRSIDHRIAV
jgi:hypothetical protein